MSCIIEAFRVPRKKQAIRLQQWCKSLQNFKLRFFIEVNHHIAAENRIQRAAYLPVMAEQIHLSKTDHGAQLRPYPHKACLSASPFKEKTPHYIIGKFLYALNRINTRLRLGKHIGIEIRSNDGHLWSKTAESVHHGHGD